MPLTHSWDVSPSQAIELQRELAPKVIQNGSLDSTDLIAGADLAFSPDKRWCIAGVVVWAKSEHRVTEQIVVRRRVRFPYVPGLLSFREAPAILAAIVKLKSAPDVFLFDGQGYAHPRRLGLASHVGLWIDRPSVGCAKSVLVGTGDEPEPRKGSMAELRHRGEVVAMSLRTRDRVKPVFVSVGHRISLVAAAKLVLSCCTRFRLPEPTRLADQLVGRSRLLPREQ
ncbi:MAG: deoxyribonuclease V [Planctomycetota bacterium]